MKRSNIVTGLDIGSSKVAAVAAEIAKDSSFTILAQITQNSKGISYGAIANLNDAVSSVTAVLTKLREKISKSPGQIYVNVSGQTIKGSHSSGMIPLSIRGREITKADMDRCANVAGTIHLPFDREIIHRIVQRYSVDDKPWIANPLGLFGSRLSCEVYVITADMNQIQNIYKCVNNAGYDVKELVFTGMADGAALLDKEDKESNILLLDIGASVTEACIFAKGVLADSAIIPMGADNIKDDYRNNPRMNELCSDIETLRQSFIKRGGAIDSIILTGGTAFIDYLVEFMEEKLACKVDVGAAKDIKGDISSIDSVRLTTAIGLVNMHIRTANPRLSMPKSFRKTYLRYSSRYLQ